VPPRIKTVLDDGGDRIIVMPAYLPRSRALATKIVTVFPGNAARRLPLIVGAVLLNDATTGLPLAVIDGASITDLRTAAASAVATRALAGPGPRTLALIGAGARAARTCAPCPRCMRSTRSACVRGASRARVVWPTTQRPAALRRSAPWRPPRRPLAERMLS
jgi:ornithine cyclodeaminase